MPETFAAQLRRHRASAGLSQQALATRAGLSRRGIADLERGVRQTPYPDTVRRLAAALGLQDGDRDTFMAACRRGDEATRAASDRYQLPTDPTALIGRGRELVELQDLLARTRLLTLTGAGGIGKTRLALELAHRTEAALTHGAVVVDLAPLLDPTRVEDVIAAALGIGPARHGTAQELIVQHLKGKQLLIMVDNCEHLVADCAVAIDLVLRCVPGLTVIVTSREALRIHGETVWIVPPLQQTEAVALFRDRAVEAGAALRSVESDAIGAMCRYLDGIPLAIELAAARVPMLGIVQVAELLTDRLAFLSRGSRLDPPRHQTLRAALDWSHELLTAGEQRLFARLAVFVGGWTLDGALAVGSGDDPAGSVAGSSVLDQLTGLVDKSLVLGEEVAGRRRFRYLETIRAYAVDRLGLTGEEPDVRSRHVSYLRAICEEGAASRLGMRYPGDVERVRAEWANLQAALGWLRDHDQLEDGLALCTALSGFWLGQGLLDVGEEWLAAFLGEPTRVPPQALAAGLHARGRLAEYGGAFDRAADLYRSSREISVAAGDRVVQARATCGLADLALHHGANAEAHELFAVALDAARAAGADAETAQCLLSLGRSAAAMGELDQTRDYLEQALEIERRLGDRWGVAYVLQLSGEQARQAGRLREGQGLLEEAHVLWRQAGTKMGERAAVMNLALATAQLGELARAQELALTALALSEELDDTASATTARVVEISAQVLHASGRPDTAVRLLAAATGSRSAIDAPRPAPEQPEISALLEQSRSQLGDQTFTTAWHVGLELAMDDAVELAAERLRTNCVPGEVWSPEAPTR